MRIVFAGNPGIAVPSLEALVNLQLAGKDYRLAGVLTSPDRIRGRRKIPEPLEISIAASRFSERLRAAGQGQILQFKPEKLSPEVGASIAPLEPDLLVSFAYRHLFSPAFLALFSLGGINIHPSLLPQYRGPSPIQAAILNREQETGITIQTLASAMDTGDILAQERFPLTGRETAASLSDAFARKAADLLPGVLQGIAQGSIQRKSQDNRDATYCSLIAKGDGRIDWSCTAAHIDAQIRAFTPWPLAWTLHGQEYLYLLEGAPYTGTATGAKPGTLVGTDKQEGILVQTGEGILGITRLQYRTKKALAWGAFLNGARDFLHTSLG